MQSVDDNAKRTGRSTLIATVLYVLLLVALCLPSPSRVTGDGPEYVLLARRLARGESPNIPLDTARAHGLFEPRLVDRLGAQQLWHFWAWPLLVSPLLRAAGRVADEAPARAFTIVNITLLALAFGVAYRRLGLAAALFAGCSPILWWVDKAQVEAFTVALVILGCALIARPHLAAIAFGLAATQNPPFAAVSLLLVFIAVRRARFADTADRRAHAPIPLRIWIGGLIATLLSLLHPLFYLWRLGRWTPLVETADARIPGMRALLTIVFDLNVGLLVHAPIVLVMLVLSGIAAALAARRRVPTAAARLAVFVGMAALFLIASAQAPNVNSGGTTGISRYALWLVPLPLLVWPLFRSRLPWIVTIASAVWSLWLFQPATPESYLSPTPIASRIWSAHPSWENPLPEIFAERLRHQDGAHPLAATPDCAKVLVLDAQWPAPCASQRLPEPCRAPGALCYANRRADGAYDFIPTSRRGGIHLSSWLPRR